MKIKIGISAFVFCFIMLMHGVFAQAVDSFELELNSVATVAERVPLLKHMGEWYLSQRDTAALRYFRELIVLSDQTNDELLKPYAYYRMGVCRYQQNDIEGATALYFQGLESTNASREFNEMKAKLYNGLGWNFNLIGKQESALGYLQQARHYASADHAQLMGLILNNMGVVYKNLQHYDSALLSFQQSLTFNRKIADQRQVRFNLNNIGNVLLALGRFKESEVYFNEVLVLNTEAKDTIEIVNNLINLSLVSDHDNLLLESRAQLMQAMLLAKATNTLDQQRRIYFLQAGLAERQKNYGEALGFQKEYYKLTDSLYRKDGIEHALEAEAKYMSLVKEKELQEAREHVVEQRFYLSIIIGALLITIIVIFFLGRMVRIRKRNERELLVLNSEIQKQSEELLRANKTITEANEALEQLVKYRTEVIQNQSKRISHFSFVNSHEIRGPLATLMGLLGLLYKEESPEKSKEILGFLKITSAKLDKIIRSVSRELEKEEDQA